MNRVPRQTRSSPQTLPPTKPTRRRKPLSDRNSSSSTSSDAPPAPRGCFRFLLSNPTSRSTPRKSPKPDQHSSASSTRPRYRSRVPPVGDGGKDHSSHETVKNAGASSRDSEKGMCPCPSSSSKGNCAISTPGRVNEQGTPPVQASISPEIHCGSEIVKDGSACFAAGHIVSRVKDRRKCRPRGLLTVGERDVNLGLETDCKANASVVVPMPAEASVRWVASPGDAKGNTQNLPFRPASCSPRDGIDLGIDYRIGKFGWDLGEQNVGDHSSDAGAEAENGSLASPWSETTMGLEYKGGSLCDQNEVAHCHNYACEHQSTKSLLNDSPGVEIKGAFENKGSQREVVNCCKIDSCFDHTPKNSFAFHRDELILGGKKWFRDKECSDSDEFRYQSGGGDRYCKSQECPNNWSFAFAGLDCSPSDEVELGFQYKWGRSSSSSRAKDTILEWEMSSENSARSDREATVSNLEIKPIQSLSEAEVTDLSVPHEVITNHLEIKSIQSLSEAEITPQSIGREVISNNLAIKSSQSLSEAPYGYGCGAKPASAPCDFKSTSNASSSSSESNCRIDHVNHVDIRTGCLKLEGQRHEETSPQQEETSFSESKKLLPRPNRSESTGRSGYHNHGVTLKGCNTLDIGHDREVSFLVTRETSSYESGKLLSQERSKSDGSIAPENCSRMQNKFTKFDGRNCKEGSLVMQEAPSSKTNKVFACTNTSEISPVTSPGSLWNQNVMCTPYTDSNDGSLELNSMDEVLQTLRMTHDRSAFLPLPGFDLQFYCAATPYHSANGTRFWDPSTELDAISLRELHEQGNELLSPTFDNISRMRISWREGLVSRMFEMDELDVSDWRETEGEVHSQEHKAIDHDPNLGSPVLDDKQFLQLSSGFGSFELLHERQDGGIEDSDWKICYRNSLFAENG